MRVLCVATNATEKDVTLFGGQTVDGNDSRFVATAFRSRTVAPTKSIAYLYHQTPSYVNATLSERVINHSCVLATERVEDIISTN